MQKYHDEPKQYKGYLKSALDRGYWTGKYSDQWMSVRRVNELRGKNLACWCPLDAPCHADVLLKIANSPG